MSTRRWAGAGFGLLIVAFLGAGGCSSEDDMPAGNPDGGGGADAAVCSTTVEVVACNRVAQNGVEFELGCSSIVNTTIQGKPVCAVSGECTGGCLNPQNVKKCLTNCRPSVGGDGGSSPLGTACTSNTDCTAGFTCLKTSDNIVPGSGPPNGICTTDCSASAAAQSLCTSYDGICVRFSETSTKSYCLESCTTGEVPIPNSKCHGREDMVCASLLPSGFGCIPLCATDADCGSRKCDLGTGLCTDFVTPGAPIGSNCSADTDCAGAICYPFVTSDAAVSPGVCSAACRIGTIEGCGFRTSPLDAGPPVGACLLGPTASGPGDMGICAQLCDTVNDCATQDRRWTCVPDADVRAAFGHAGYCWLGMRPEGGTGLDAAAETGAPEASAPEASAPEASAPEASPDVPAESGGDTPAPDADGADSVTPPADGASD
jgi:hypothetical protein